MRGKRRTKNGKFPMLGSERGRGCWEEVGVGRAVADGKVVLSRMKGSYGGWEPRESVGGQGLQGAYNVYHDKVNFLKKAFAFVFTLGNLHKKFCNSK